MRCSNLGLPCGLLALLSASVTAQLPYFPTRLFPSSKNNGEFIYLLDPPSSDTPSGRLRAFSATSTLSSRSEQLTTISPTLPFFASTSNFAYIPTLDSDGTISVYAGTCTADAEESALWRFTPGSPDGSGAWRKESYEIENAVTKSAQTGPNFLASALSFLPTTAQKIPDLYIFGGMCPFANSTDETWASSAAYSNQLLVFRSDGNDDYDFALGTSNGPPIAEAGFSITPLQPTLSKRVGDGQTQQQNFLLLGGHTQTAFINMSQVAIFSLPQAIWSFQPVDSPDSKTDLMARAPAVVEPRSGHTAVLSEDGTKVVLFGGWVGDVTNPADPQFAVLEVGVGYGGVGNWQWSTIDSDKSPVTGGSGIYGHGATLLPGNVMMVTGGYLISPNGVSRSKRADRPQSSQNYFFNITSELWMDSYNPSLVPTTDQDDEEDSGPLSSDSQKAGLAVGIVLFLLLLAVVLTFGYFYRKKLKKERLEREQELEEESREKEIDELGAYTYQYSNLDGEDANMGIWDGRGRMSNPAYAWAGNGRGSGHPSAGRRSTNGWDAERSGLDVEIPSPSRGLRRGMHSRTNPYVTSRYDDGRGSRQSGNFPPIDELDEEESGEKEQETTPSKRIRRKPVPAPREKSPGPNLDPFKDPDPPSAVAGGSKTVRRIPTQTTHDQNEPVSPAEERQREMHGWIRDWAAVGSAMAKTSTGRNSPTKSDRTESNLSDRSNRSGFSSKSNNTSSNSGPSRAASSLSGYGYFLPRIFNPFAAAETSPSKENVKDPRRPKSATDDSDSFITANTNNTHLQSESEALLGSSRHQHSASTSSDAIEPDNEPTFTQRDQRQLRARPRMGEWVIGSVRRALPAISLSGTRSASMTSTSVRPPTITGGFMDHSPTHEDWSGSSSPTKRHASAPMTNPSLSPRRSMSDSANFAFWAGKRGAKDWGVNSGSHMKDKAGSFAGTEGREAANAIAAEEARRRALGVQASAKASRGSTGEGNTAEGEDEEDWNPEDAIQERVVQLMFTVPRERLRVVNADGDVGSVSDMGDVRGAEDADAAKRASELSLELPQVIDGHGSLDMDFFDGEGKLPTQATERV